MRIFDFAKIADWDDRLEALAGVAEPERWTYLHAPSQSPLPVLSSYIQYTFLRAFDQQKIVEGDRLACFNTGLLTPGQEEIFGVLPFPKRMIGRSRFRSGIRSGGSNFGFAPVIGCSPILWSFRVWQSTGMTRRTLFLIRNSKFN
jgi:hypothetical protein